MFELALALVLAAGPTEAPVQHAEVAVYSADFEGGYTLCDEVTHYLGVDPAACVVLPTEDAPPAPYDAANATNSATVITYFTDQPTDSQGPQVTAGMLADKFPVAVAVLPACSAPEAGTVGTTFQVYDGPTEDELFGNDLL